MCRELVRQCTVFGIARHVDDLQVGHTRGELGGKCWPVQLGGGEALWVSITELSNYLIIQATTGTVADQA